MADQDNVANPQQQMTLLQETGLDPRSSTLIVELGEMFVENLVESRIYKYSGFYLLPIVYTISAEKFDLHTVYVPTIHSNGADLKTAVVTAVWDQMPYDAPLYHDDFDGNPIKDITMTDGTVEAVQNFTQFRPIRLHNPMLSPQPIVLHVRFYWSLTCVDVFPQFTYSWFDDDGIYDEYVSPIYIKNRLLCPSLTINSHCLFN